MQSFRQASQNQESSLSQQALNRVALRFLRGNLNTPIYDLMARLQVLESAAKIVTPHPMTGGPWSKNPRLGVKAAQSYFAETDIDPEWFSLENTGFISKIRAMLLQVYNKYTKGRESHFDVDDLIQNGLMGLTKDGTEQLSTGPLLIHFGYTYPNLGKILSSGRFGPKDLAGIAAKNYVKKLPDQFVSVDKGRTPTETPAGQNILDRQPGSESNVDFANFLQDVLSQGSALGQKLERVMRALARSNPVAQALVDKLVQGEEPHSISGLGKELGGSGSGGAVRWVKEVFYPAVAEYVQNDDQLLTAYWNSTGGVRLARSHR
jgi:hypothetical protein